MTMRDRENVSLVFFFQGGGGVEGGDDVSFLLSYQCLFEGIRSTRINCGVGGLGTGYGSLVDGLTDQRCRGYPSKETVSPWRNSADHPCTCWWRGGLAGSGRQLVDD